MFAIQSVYLWGLHSLFSYLRADPTCRLCNSNYWKFSNIPKEGLSFYRGRQNQVLNSASGDPRPAPRVLSIPGLQNIIKDRQGHHRNPPQALVSFLSHEPLPQEPVFRSMGVHVGSLSSLLHRERFLFLSNGPLSSTYLDDLLCGE